MIYHFILNPKSGRGRKYKNLETVIQTACRSRQLNYRIYYTTCPGDATEYVASMVRISDDNQRFICVGGDGTLNEVVNSAPCNPKVEFGIIPNGSGNDFVRNFTNTDAFTSVEAQLDGESVSLDLIKCNDNYCVNMVNIGFDCAVAKQAAKLKKIKLFPPGFSYTISLVINFFKKSGTDMKLIFDDGTVVEKKFMLTAIGNGKYCGGGYCAAPNADMQDGILSLIAIDNVSKFTFLSLVSSYKAGTHLENPKALKVIANYNVPHFKMEFKSPVPICIDGEIKGAKSIDFTVIKNGFNFIVPKGSEFQSKN